MQTRRRLGLTIARECERVRDALAHCRVETTRATLLAQVVLAVEGLEDEGRTHNEIRTFLEEVLLAPMRVDPRADTRGT